MFLTEGRPDTPMSTASTTSSQTFDLDMSEHSVSQGQSPRAAYTNDAVGSPARMLTQSPKSWVKSQPAQPAYSEFSLINKMGFLLLKAPFLFQEYNSASLTLQIGNQSCHS